MTDEARKTYLEELERAAEAGDVGYALRLRRERLADRVAAGLDLFSNVDANGRLPGEQPPRPPQPGDGPSDDSSGE